MAAQQQSGVSKAGRSWNSLERSVTSIGTGRVHNVEVLKAAREDTRKNYEEAESETPIQEALMGYIFGTGENPYSEALDAYEKEEQRIDKSVDQLIERAIKL